jgi:diguanylate cyclase (GGDEF)-like protein
MRISTITNWAYGITVLLTACSGAAFLYAARAAEAERVAVEQHLTFDVLAEDLAVGAEKPSDYARLYAMRGDQRHLDSYRYEATQERTRERALERVRSMGAAPVEVAAVAEAHRNLAELDALEAAGIEAAERGDRALAQRILYGADFERAQAAVLSALDHFRSLVSARTQMELEQARLDNDNASIVAKIMLAITALVFLSVLYFVLRRRVAVPLRRMTGIVMRLARQDYAVEVPDHIRRDEIGDMTDAIQIFRENGIERDRLEAERRADQRTKDCILQMVHRLQACQASDELAEVVVCFAPQTFPELAGRLYVFDDTRNALAQVGSWLDPHYSADSFPPTACWGVRRGHLHASNGQHQDVSCPHINDPDVRSLCVPLTAQGDTIGLLYFEDQLGVGKLEDAAPRLYLELLSENVSLALANLRLRERLANLAARDALTGLLNRRCLDETLMRQPGNALACVMIDIDHFKRFNDEFGHDAGDAVMQHVAELMRATVGELGRAYRFGGEEFTILLPDADEREAFELAETLRTQIAAAPLAHHGRLLGHITISLGVAASPGGGSTATLLKRADAALLHAKSQGRNCTMAASHLPDTGDRRAASAR